VPCSPGFNPPAQDERRRVAPAVPRGRLARCAVGYLGSEGPMPAGARLAIIEFKSGELPQGPPESIKVQKAELIALLKKAGFTLKEDRPKLLPYQEFLVCVKS